MSNIPQIKMQKLFWTSY